MDCRSGWKLGVLVVLASLAGPACALEDWIEDSERFPGWKGEIPLATSQQDHSETMTVGELGKVGSIGLYSHFSHQDLTAASSLRSTGNMERQGGAAVLGAPRLPFPRLPQP